MPKSGYDYVPDAEAARDEGPSTRSKEAAKQKYGIEGEQEVELLAMMDAACEMKPTFDFPVVDPEELASQGRSFLWSIIAPSISVVCTIALAWLLSATSQGEDWIAKVSTCLTPLFPYFNAAVVFMSSFLPIQQRFRDSMEPIFDKIDGVQDDAERNVDQLANRVDTIVDRIQAKVNQVLAPYLPKLAMATKMETIVKQIKPDIDLPDPSDIDREFDEAQGLVGTKLDEAKERLDIHSIIPTVLQSSEAFFWRIVVPFGVLALATQFLVVATTPLSSTSNNVLGGATSSLQDSSTSLESQLNSLKASTENGSNRQLWELVSTIPSEQPIIRKRVLVDLLAGDATDHVGDELRDISATTVGTYQDQALNDAKVKKTKVIDDASKALQNVTASGNTFRDKVISDAQETVTDIQSQANDVITSANATFNGYRTQAEDQMDAAKSQIKPMLTSIALSYLVALLQLALAYVLTGNKVKTFCINMALHSAKSQVDKVLEESGVPAMIDDVLVTRMQRIHGKILKILRVAGELDDVLDKIPGSGEALNKASDAIGKIGGRLGLGGFK